MMGEEENTILWAKRRDEQQAYNGLRVTLGKLRQENWPASAPMA